jgi:restriction system protein
MDNIDSMSGVEFEDYLEGMLTTQGYSVKLTPGSSDFGVDLVATCSSEKIAIQVKRHRTRISRRAVSDAVAGMHHYRCDSAMVITNSYFTEGAVKLAKSTGCTLIDRDALARWIVQIEGSHPEPKKVIQASSRPEPEKVIDVSSKVTGANFLIVRCRACPQKLRLRKGEGLVSIRCTTCGTVQNVLT